MVLQALRECGSELLQVLCDLLLMSIKFTKRYGLRRISNLLYIQTPRSFPKIGQEWIADLRIICKPVQLSGPTRSKVILRTLYRLAR
jgi:hypothetical protein